MIMGHVRARRYYGVPHRAKEPHGFCRRFLRISSDWSDALACPIVPLAMQTLVGTANKDAGKCPPMRIQRAKSEAEIMKPIACRAETMERRLRAEP
jgi:hypothetical protein